MRNYLEYISKNIFAPIKAKYSQLEQRDQWIAVGVGTLISIMLLYLIIIAPISDKLTSLQQQTSNNAILLSWMQKNVSKLVQVRGLSRFSRANNTKQAKLTSVKDLLSYVETQLQAGDMRRYQSQLSQTNTDGVQLRLTAVPFSKLVVWLRSLNQNAGVEIKEARFERLTDTNKPEQDKQTETGSLNTPKRGHVNAVIQLVIPQAS